MSKRWQYKVVEVKPTWLGVKPEHIEAQLGLQGWELVSVTPHGMGVRLYLKKEN
ncbi:DUF4177 domain-containing protein [Luteimonas sp. RIT-PG2_3]